MVNFGDSLKESRRRDWEHAYLDYDKLKHMLSLLDGSRKDENRNRDIRSNKNMGDHEPSVRWSEAKEMFFKELGKEIEKISLFTLATQGTLSEAIGYLRFRDDNTINVENIFPQTSQIRASGGDCNNDLDVFIRLGVEFLFLVQFLGINILAVRKILKKYNKINRRLNKPTYTFAMDGKDDLHLQLIASSKSLSAIHSSLQSTMVNHYFNDDQLSSDPRKWLQFFRFQSIILASYVLRKNSEIVSQPFRVFLSRKALITVGSSLGGIEGSEMLAMNVVLEFSPEMMLTGSLEELDAMWIEWSPRYEHWKVKERITMDARLSVKDITKYSMQMIAEEEAGWRSREQSLRYGSKRYGFEENTWGGINTKSMMLNLASVLLYTINYYIVAPTANRYAMILGEDGAYGATLIGMSSISAIIAALLYSFWYTNSSFKSALIFSSVCPLLGNIVYALAISFDSMAMAVCGRFMCGFGSAEVINRQLISTCVSFKQMTRASALFVTAGALGMSIGPLIAAILDNTTGRDVLVDLHLPFIPAGGIIFNSLTSPGFVMALLWFTELLCLVLFFREPERINDASSERNDEKSETQNTEISSLLHVDYGSMEDKRSELNASDFDSDSLRSNLKIIVHQKGFWGEIKSAFRLLMVKKGLPVTLLLFCYIELADEVLISSCSMIVRRYFGWHASAAGFLVASLGALVLPANFFVEICSRRVSERFIMKLSIYFIITCCFAILNYQGLYYDIIGISTYGKLDPIDTEHLKRLELSGEDVGVLLTKSLEFPYDWDSGTVVYITFMSAMFAGTIILEGVTTSIMAQVTPSQLNSCFINSGLLATLIGTIGRVLSDSMITISALLDIHIFIDFVNATFLPLLVLAIGCLLLVYGYYDKLA